MVQENAHETFIAIPLNVVASWQLICLPDSHVSYVNIRRLSTVFCSPTFAFFLRMKKVAKREYRIEDSATYTTFSRDHPWTSLCKPGLKSGMSILLNDKSKTTMVCSKSDTTSNEWTGVMVKW